jgi:hypothetical protein
MQSLEDELRNTSPHKEDLPTYHCRLSTDDDLTGLWVETYILCLQLVWARSVQQQNQEMVKYQEGRVLEGLLYSLVAQWAD